MRQRHRKRRTADIITAPSGEIWRLEGGTALNRPPTFALLVYSSFKVPVGRHSCASPAFTGPRFRAGRHLVFTLAHPSRASGRFTPGQRQGAARWRTTKIKMRRLTAGLGFLQGCEQARNQHRRPWPPAGPRATRASEPRGRLPSIPWTAAPAHEALRAATEGEEESGQPPRPPCAAGRSSCRDAPSGRGVGGLLGCRRGGGGAGRG